MFTTRQRFGMAMVVFAMIGAGCAVDATDVPENLFDNSTLQTQGGGAGGDPNTGNGLGDDCLNDDGVLATMLEIGDDPIADAYHHLPDLTGMGMPTPTDSGAPSGCRRKFLTDLVECALSGTTTYIPARYVYDYGDMTSTPLGSIPRKYYGKHGLAPAWESRGLTTNEKEFVTACMMARTNGANRTLDILMQSHDPIGYDEEQRETFSYAESTVWGNMFQSDFVGHVCHNNSSGFCIDSEYRICDESTDSCGFVQHGDCSLTLSVLCTSSTPPSYCTGWSNRITVFLKPSDLNIGAETCETPVSYPGTNGL